MKYINYSERRLLTGDAIARAVLDLAAALARVDDAESVTIPSIDGEGRRTETTLLLGPASQIVVDDHEDDGGPGAELVDEQVLAELVRRTRVLGAPHPVTTRASDIVAPED